MVRRSAVRAALLALVPLLLAGCGGSETFSVSPCETGGSHLVAFASDRGHAGQFDVYLFDTDGNGFRLLKDLNSDVASDSSPALTSDGRVIAFVTRRGATGSDLLVYDRGSCSFVNALVLQGPGDESQPVFTGDALRLAFVRDTLGHRRIRMLHGRSLAYIPLPGLDSTAAWNDWSPAPDQTGTRIAFVSDREGAPHLYLYDRGTGRIDSLRALRKPGATDLDAALSSDARYLAFASDWSGGRGRFDLYLYDLTTSALVPLPGLNTAFDERRPSINTGADFIAFQSDSTTHGGWDVRYYLRGGGGIGAPAGLAGALDDISPSVRYP